MPDRMNGPDSGEESPEARRERESANEVAEWEAAFRGGRSESTDPPTDDADRAHDGPGGQSAP